MDLLSSSINTDGGTVVGKSVDTQGGTFVGRDQTIINVHVLLPSPTTNPQSEQHEESNLHLINFTRPLTPAQVKQIEESVGRRIGIMIDVTLFFDESRAFAPQCVTFLDQIGLTGKQWQTLPIIVNLPGLAAAAACLLGELHGRLGHFPSLVRLSAQSNNNLGDFGVVEVIDVQAVRDAARKRKR